MLTNDAKACNPLDQSVRRSEGDKSCLTCRNFAKRCFRFDYNVERSDVQSEARSEIKFGWQL